MASPKLYQAFPGFKWAVGIFAIYCSGEWVYGPCARSLICRYKRFIRKPKAIKDKELSESIVSFEQTVQCEIVLKIS